MRNEPTRPFERLVDLFRDHAQQGAGMTQAQREALVDVLVWTMFVDRHIAAPEQTFIEEQAADLRWSAPRPIGAFIDASMGRIRKVLGDDGAEESYLEDIARRLADDPARRGAHAACGELSRVDGEVARPEQEHLDRIARRFGL